MKNKEFTLKDLMKELGVSSRTTAVKYTKLVYPNKKIEKGVKLFYTEQELENIVKFYNQKENKIEQTMSTSEIGKVFKTSNKVILDKAKKVLDNKRITNGKKTNFNKQEAIAIANEIKKSKDATTFTANANKVNIIDTLPENTLNSEEVKKNGMQALDTFLKLPMDLQLKGVLFLNDKILKQVKQENQKLKEKVNLIQQEKKQSLSNKEIWMDVYSKILKIAKRDYQNDIKRCFLYYYQKFAKIHPYLQNTISKELFIKNRDYLLELKDFVDSDL